MSVLPKMNRVFLLLGGNLGNVAVTFEQARQLVLLRIGDITAVSSLYQSEPWGFSSCELFLNQVLELTTQLGPNELLQVLLEIESSMGRTRAAGLITSRPIDIDILFYNDQVVVLPQLEIPHPRLHLRRFTLLPLAELAPEMIHPLFAQTVAQLLEECNDPLAVTKFTIAENTTG
jgi:2-amino-4-hydroxy-6-hydroxymethyldihydropteridine diphosphokinase